MELYQVVLIIAPLWSIALTLEKILKVLKDK
jgi:hypothetical protein